MNIICELLNNRHPLSELEIDNYKKQAEEITNGYEKIEREHAKWHGGYQCDGQSLYCDKQGWRERTEQFIFDNLILQDFIRGKNL